MINFFTAVDISNTKYRSCRLYSTRTYPYPCVCVCVCVKTTTMVRTKTYWNILERIQSFYARSVCKEANEENTPILKGLEVKQKSCKSYSYSHMRCMRLAFIIRASLCYFTLVIQLLPRTLYRIPFYMHW